MLVLLTKENVDHSKLPFCLISSIEEFTEEDSGEGWVIQREMLSRASGCGGRATTFGFYCKETVRYQRWYNWVWLTHIRLVSNSVRILTYTLSAKHMVNLEGSSTPYSTISYHVPHHTHTPSLTFHHHLLFASQWYILQIYGKIYSELLFPSQNIV